MIDRARILIASAALAVAIGAKAQAPERPPEECLVTPSEKPAATLAHGGKTYAFRFPDCAETFQTDPERYAQLYDALLEMRRAGAAPAAPRSPSLVPS